MSTLIGIQILRTLILITTHLYSKCENNSEMQTYNNLITDFRFYV